MQNADQSTSHPLLRCQVVLTKRQFQVLSEIELSEFELLSFITIWVWVFFLRNLSFIIIWVFEFFSPQFEFYHNLSFWVLLLFESHFFNISNFITQRINGRYWIPEWYFYQFFIFIFSIFSSYFLKTLTFICNDPFKISSMSFCSPLLFN